MRLRTTADIAVLVRNARLDAGLTQAALAERAGVGRKWVVRLERAHGRLEIAKVLAVLASLDLQVDAAGRDDHGRDENGLSAGTAGATGTSAVEGDELLDAVFDRLGQDEDS